ncbi:zinc finger protein ZFPM1 isoform X1 [Ochotona princeps]|uniref:zinc finger protein ZFPM1 isoform X1 n=1 Tax=Ochotona princeps TaxID=9978 RepID=UPI002714C83C|nr:zinc finger protein ZFPM1 isoform X1 [Ochotona princeps]
MSRRKQSNPRQIKRSLGDMETSEETQAMDTSLTEHDTTQPEPSGLGEPQPPSPPRADAALSPPPAPPTSPGAPKEEMEGPEPEATSPTESSNSWTGPDELESVLCSGQQQVRARDGLTRGLAWGPFQGSIKAMASSPRQAELDRALPLLVVDETCWLKMLPQALTQAEANCEISRKDEGLWCRVTKPVPVGGLLSVFLVDEPGSVPSEPVKEPAEPTCPAPANSDIRLLPQQAGMASILATAVVNKDVFPCKDCGIWYRSERNLQAHLLYYCASRQGSGSPATAAAEKPKEPYPNERICPFPQCRKSCPSASSLEIHLRSHSGERPFVCLICLSAFTTKANCERHLKVHTDSLSGVCHSCGFISTTRDILYSHLVTSHMVCQPGSKGEVYLPGGGHAGMDRKALVEATNGEAKGEPQNGGSEPPAVPKTIKPEAAEEPEAAQEPEAVRAPGEPATQTPSRTPSPPSPAPARVKAELSSPTPGSSPVPSELGLAGALFLPQYVLGPDAGAPPGPTAPQASEILAKMSELVHGRLQTGAAGAAALLAGTPKGATCFECDITFNSLSNFLVHKRLYCSGRRAPEEPPAGRRPKAPPMAPPEPDAPRSPPGPGAREDEAGGAATPEADTAGRGSEGSQSPGSSVDEADDDPSRTLCEACNIRFSRHETYTVHKRYYCASRHDPPPRRPPAPPAAPARTRRRRKLHELQAPGGPEPEPPASPPAPAADGPIDLSKKPRRRSPDAPAPGLSALADYHECTACRVSFHSLDAYLAHKQYSCPAPRPAPEPPSVACPYCPPNGLGRDDLIEHFRLAHGLLVGKPAAGLGPEARTPAHRGPQDGPEPRAASSSPRPAAPLSPGAPPAPADKGAAPPVPNGNPRYCRLCNIRFSSLSTFIAHKKYYCSSHAAEHVK